jgi:hypothetical protein
MRGDRKSVPLECVQKSVVKVENYPFSLATLPNIAGNALHVSPNQKRGEGGHGVRIEIRLKMLLIGLNQ